MAIVWIILVELLCVQLVSGICQPAGKSGPRCAYTCHCSNFNKCDESSDCQGQCAGGWRGRTCQQGNVALNRTTSSSQTSSGNGADKAVDGTVGERKWDQFHTLTGATSAWWSVDLGFSIYVQEVIIYFRKDYKVRRNGLQFYNSNTKPNILDGGTWGSKCHTIISDSSGSGVADDLSIPSCIGTWRYLFIYSNTSNDNDGAVLDFSEVDIYACSSGTYGSDCTMFCDGCNSDGCNTIGQCETGCRPGRTNRPVCNLDCQQGYYGADCATLCSSRRCGAPDTSTCDAETGKCQSGCSGYFTGNDCQECTTGWFGYNCTRQCNSRQCMYQQTSACDRFTSDCNPAGCRPGFLGLDCYTQCSGGRYGPNCAKSCSSRKCLNPSEPCNDIFYGSCNGLCVDGYGGTDCTECSNGKYGENCSKSCTFRHCRISSSCDNKTGECVGGCQTGWRGIDCFGECQPGSYGAVCGGNCSSRHCLKSDRCDHVYGTCTSGCSSGWMGADCTLSCTNGMYGENCLKRCIDRKCKTSSSSCDNMTGQCPDGCKEGWSGIDCLAQCPTATYGKDCINCSSRHCNGDQTCPPDGRCSQGCQDGWILATCTQACKSGFYGMGCNSSCGKCNNNETCNHITGYCSQGCPRGKIPDLCQSPCLLDADCSGTTPYCDTSATPNTCEACLLDADCTGYETCDTAANPNFCQLVCTGDRDCSGTTPKCDTAATPKICEACLLDADCSGTTPKCDASATPNVCEECPTGSYGAGCTGSCSSRQCRRSTDFCHHVTGNCSSGCKPGWMGEDCTQDWWMIAASPGKFHKSNQHMFPYNLRL